MEKLQQLHPKPRTLTKEYIDAYNFGGEPLKKNLHELAFINKHFGGNKAVRNGLDLLMPFADKTITIADIGCGSGDMLNYAQKYVKEKHSTKAVFGHGVDNNPYVLEIAKANDEFNKFDFEEADVSNMQKIPTADIIMMNLFLHHFTDEITIKYIQTCYKNARLGVLITDLHNSTYNKMLFKIGSIIFNWSFVTRHDGLASISKAFNKPHWQFYMQQAEIENYTLKLFPVGRWLCVIRKNNQI